MQFEVESHETHPDTKRVNLVPTHPDGVFRFRHYHYGERLVGKIGLAGLDQVRIHQIEIGEVSPSDLLMMGPDSLTFMPIEGAFVPVATVNIPGSRNTVQVELEHFQEMAPVELR